MSRPAVFFDRDGTLCEEVGYINHPDRLKLMPGAGSAVRKVRQAGFAAVVVTNQAGVARGYFPLHVVEATHRRLREFLAAEGTELDGIFVCLHHPDLGGPGFQAACDCRKPAPGLIFQAARELDLDLQRSFIAGDSFRDIGAGQNAGLAGKVLLRTGYGRGELLWRGTHHTVWPDFIADDLAQAVAWMMEHAPGGTR